MLVSIITPYRDSQQFLGRYVSALQAQEYKEWECLLINHNSTDGGGELARSLVDNDERFRCLDLDATNLAGGDRRLPAIPRNFGLDYARGELVCFLDVDDYWHPKKLVRQVAFMEQAGLDISVTAYGRLIESDQSTIEYECPADAITYASLLKSNNIPLLTVMSRMKIVRMTIESKDSHMFFPLIRHEDYAAWIDVWKQNIGIRYGCITEVLAIHVRHEANTTSNRIEMPIWVYRVFRYTFPGARLKAVYLLLRWCILKQWQMLFDARVVRSYKGLDQFFESEPVRLKRIDYAGD